MAACYCYCLGIKSNDFFLKDNKKAFILWLNVPKVTAYEERETIYDKLTNYIDIPDMPLDNNDTERLIRDMVMGKKAYILFFLSSGKIRNNKNEFQI